MNRIFVPITCSACGRYSAVSFPKTDLKQKLAADGAIEFRCVYDDSKWVATPAERRLMLRLLSENEVVDRSPRLFSNIAAVDGASLTA
jgi:hypothetical protein